MFRKSLAYVPRAQEATLTTQREITQAVAPHLAGNMQDWRRLSFLLNVDSARFTRSMSVPRNITDAQIAILADFFSKRMDKPLRRIEIDGEVFNKINDKLDKMGTGGYIDAEEYVITNGNDIGFSFPYYATVISLEGGELVNIKMPPNGNSILLVELVLDGVIVSEEDLAKLNTAVHMTHLALVSGSYVLSGLPVTLEVYSVSAHGRCEVLYNEGHYDCPRLRELDYGNIDELPSEFIDSIHNSLVDLTIWFYEGRGNTKLPSLLKKLTKLESLTVDWESFPVIDLWTFQPSVRELKLTGQRSMFNGSISLAGLRKLAIAPDRDLESILKSASGLEELDLDSDRTLDDLGITGVYPSIKRLSHPYDGRSVYNGRSAYDGPHAALKNIFPNLETYSDVMVEVDFKTGELTSKLQRLHGATDHELFLASLNLTKYTFIVSEAPEKNIAETMKIALPAKTERITLDLGLDKGTFIYDINRLLNSTATERERLYDSIVLKIVLLRDRSDAFISAQSKYTSLVLNTTH